MTLSLPRPLVPVAALAEVIDDPLLRIVDCRWYLGRPGDGVAAIVNADHSISGRYPNG